MLGNILITTLAYKSVWVSSYHLEITNVFAMFSIFFLGGGGGLSHSQSEKKLE
jgi:hypothetical protein